MRSVFAKSAFSFGSALDVLKINVSILSHSIVLCFKVGDCSRRTRLLKRDEEVRQTIHIHCSGVNMATCVTFICLK